MIIVAQAGTETILTHIQKEICRRLERAGIDVTTIELAHLRSIGDGNDSVLLVFTQVDIDEVAEWLEDKEPDNLQALWLSHRNVNCQCPQCLRLRDKLEEMCCPIYSSLQEAIGSMVGTT